MIRLFANIFAGHTIILVLSSLIFITATLGFAINAGMTIVSILFSVFMLFLELLVAFIKPTYLRCYHRCLSDLLRKKIEIRYIIN